MPPVPGPNPNPRPTSAAQMNLLARKRAAFARKRTATIVSEELPAVYRVENLREHEFPVVGMIVHPRIIPGFSYRVRPLNTTKYLFNGKALQLLQIGLGYGKRITFKPDSGTKNGNENYFWSDSRSEGFGFELSVLVPGDKFTVIDAHHKEIGNCEVICDKEPQKEQSHLMWPDGTIEKWVVVHIKCKIEWTECGSISEDCITGIAIASKNTRQGAATLIRIMNCKMKHSKKYKNFVTLMPGVDSHTRRITVSGEDIPVTYTISGLLNHEFPVIGTYVDKRIVPGFHYIVRPAHAKNPLFSGKALKLLTVGRGYGKKFIFESENRNSNGNYFWSDSYPEGFGFAPKAVFEGHRFRIIAGDGNELGIATVRKATSPQIEIETVYLPGGGIQKRLRIEVSCILQIGTVTIRASKVCGTAVIVRKTMNGTAVVKTIENPGLDTQLTSILRHVPGELRFVAFRHQKYVLEQEYPDSADEGNESNDKKSPINGKKV